MPRFHLHRRQGRLVVDVQADIIPSVGTRLVIPLYELSEVPRSMPRLHPIIAIEGRSHVLATHLIAAVPIPELGSPIGSLDNHYDRIVAAIDMVFNGF
jgi:toxin CcdB